MPNIFKICLVWLMLALGNSLALAEYQVNAELGPEIDTNARRISVVSEQAASEQPITSSLLRVLGSGSWRYLPAAGGQWFWLNGGAGGKLFWSSAARPADEIIAFANTSWAKKINPAFSFGLYGNYYDAFQRESVRDFRLAEGGGRTYFNHESAQTRLTVSGGYRLLQYKPLADYDFKGPTIGATVDKSFQTPFRNDDFLEWELGFSYFFAQRLYEGPAMGARESCLNSGSVFFMCNYPKDEDRRDLNHQLRLSATVTGPIEAMIWYGLEINQANSYGESFSRQALGAKITVGLWEKIFLTAKGVLQFSRFADPYFISPLSSQSFINIEDENRSSLLVQLAREIGEYWSLNFRYNLYVNESTGQTDTVAAGAVPSFWRQTFILALRFEYGI